MSTFHRVEVPVEIRAPIAVNILIVTVDSTVSGIFMPKRRMTMLNIELQNFGGRGADSYNLRGSSIALPY